MYRITQLLKEGRQLFHTDDLALLWGITNKNTLHTTISRYIAKEILYPIHKGFYSVKPIADIDKYALAQGYLHRYMYVSCETILALHGVIFQKGSQVTLVSGVSVKFSLAGENFLVRKLADKYLYNPYGVENDNGVLKASLERAVADMLYYNPKYHFDNVLAIDFKTVKKVQKEVYSI
jgi:predicted transcriptional regulator of viral defense system